MSACLLTRIRRNACSDEVARIAPRELLTNDEADPFGLHRAKSVPVSAIPSTAFDRKNAEERAANDIFKVSVFHSVGF